jgi:hypothetical protein
LRWPETLPVLRVVRIEGGDLPDLPFCTAIGYIALQ